VIRLIFSQISLKQNILKDWRGSCSLQYEWKLWPS